MNKIPCQARDDKMAVIQHHRLSSRVPPVIQHHRLSSSTPARHRKHELAQPLRAGDTGSFKCKMFNLELRNRNFDSFLEILSIPLRKSFSRYYIYILQNFLFGLSKIS